MQKNSQKPVLVPTVYSARVVLWSVALVALFGALLWIYYAWSGLAKAREKLGEPMQAVVETPLFTVRLPLGWEAYSKDGNVLAVFRKKGQDIPILFLLAETDPGFPYHALDVNPAIVLHLVEEDILAEHLDGIPEELPIKVIGSEQLTVRPGVTAVRMLFDIAGHDGEAMVFYAGDIRYVLWGLWKDEDAESAADIHRFFRRMFEDFDLPERREYIDRPVVDSGKLTSKMNADVLRQVQREMALWRLFEIQERVALSSDDFKLYQRLLDERREDVDEWFVVLDKAVAMRDWDKARRQARWIMSHATLTGERADVRRAADILATKIPPEDDGNAGK